MTKCKFQSGEEENYTINLNEEVKVEKSINKGTFSVVDPIESLTIASNNSTKEINFEPKGVEIHSYDISNSENDGISIKKIG